jgi:hypothetical protein
MKRRGRKKRGLVAAIGGRPWRFLRRENRGFSLSF